MTNPPSKRPPDIQRSIEDVYADLKAMGVSTTSNATEIVREMRDERTEHLANLVLGSAKTKSK